MRIVPIIGIRPPSHIESRYREHKDASNALKTSRGLFKYDV